MTINEFSNKLFAAAREAGFTAAEIYYVENENFQAKVREGSVDEYKVAMTKGISFRAQINGQTGYSYSEVMDEDAISLLIRGALDAAAILEETSPEFISPPAQEYADVNPYNKALETTGAQEKIALAMGMEKAALEYDSRIIKTGYGSMIQSGTSKVVIKNTLGMDLEHKDNYILGFIDVVARNESGKVNSGAWDGVARDAAKLDTRSIAETAAREGIAGLDAKQLPQGKYSVILRAEAFTELLQTFSGIFSAEAAQKGLSLLKGKEGSAIASPMVTLIDDPHMPNGIASRAFDAEGTATYNKAIIEKGIFKTLLHNQKTAHKDGVASTGNAAKAGYKSPIGISESNFVLQPGKLSLEEMMLQIGDGIVVTQMDGLHAGANPVSGDFSAGIKGYRFEKGKRVHAVEQVTLAGNFYNLLKNIQVIGSDVLEAYNGYYMPSVAIGEMPVSGE